MEDSAMSELICLQVDMVINHNPWDESKWGENNKKSFSVCQEKTPRMPSRKILIEPISIKWEPL